MNYCKRLLIISKLTNEIAKTAGVGVSLWIWILYVWNKIETMREMLISGEI